VVAEVIVAFVGPVLLAEYMSPLESRGSPATGVRLILHRWRRSRRVAPSSIHVVQELLPHVGWEPRLRPGPSASSLVIAVRPRQRAQWHPVCQPAFEPCGAAFLTRVRVAKSPFALA
jgi:hypothetical protein